MMSSRSAVIGIHVMVALTELLTLQIEVGLVYLVLTLSRFKVGSEHVIEGIGRSAHSLYI